MEKLGFMQGRFTEWGYFNPQQFPWKTWENEFYIAKKYNLNYIEWMFNDEDYMNNPIWSEAGRRQMINAAVSSKLNISSVCANFFMNHSILDTASMQVLHKLMEFMKMVNVSTLVIPMFGKSKLETKKEMDVTFNELFSLHNKYKIDILIETDSTIENILHFEHYFNESGLKICYDLGNAIGNHYNVSEELELLLSRRILGEVHIKDKNKDGQSVILGKGEGDLVNYFRILKNYEGVFIMENYYDNTLDMVSGIEFIYKGVLERI